MNKHTGEMNKLKAYMGYAAPDGWSAGAILIFANTYKEAKKIGFGFLDCDFLDFRVKKQGMNKTIIKEMLVEAPHVIDNPTTCLDCETWGYELNEDGICEGCRELLDEV